MDKKRWIKVLITAFLAIFLGLAGKQAYAAESRYYDGQWTVRTANGDSFTITINNNIVEKFTAYGFGSRWEFPATTVDLENNNFITTAGVSEFWLNFDPEDNTKATGSMIVLSEVTYNGGFTLVAAVNTTPINPNITYLEKSAWTNILPKNDQKLADSLMCLNDLAWNGKSYVIVGRGKILNSTDGTSWKTVYSMEDDKPLYGVVWNGKEYTAVGTDEAKNSMMVLKSTNGTDWKVYNPKITGYVLDIATNGKTYVAVGEEGVLVTSSDGVKWKEANISVTNSIYKVEWAGDKFVAVGFDTILTSSDGSSWTKAEQSGFFRCVVYYNKQYYIIDNDGKILITKDFKKWSTSKVQMPANSNSILAAACSDKTMFVVTMSKTNLLGTSDMSKWTSDPLSEGSAINNIIYDNGRYFLVGPAYISVYIPPETKASTTISVTVNGSKQTLKNAPYMSGDALMLPVKEVLEKAGCKVKISGKKVTITKGTKTVTLTAGSATAVLNKKNTKLEAKVASKSSVIYAPLKKIIEALGGTYTWDAKKKAATIKFK